MPADRPCARVPSSTCFRGFRACWTASWNCYPFGTSSSLVRPLLSFHVFIPFPACPHHPTPSHSIACSSFLSDPSSRPNSHPPELATHLRLNAEDVPIDHAIFICGLHRSRHPTAGSASANVGHYPHRSTLCTRSVVLTRESTLHRMSRLFDCVLGLPMGF